MKKQRNNNNNKQQQQQKKNSLPMDHKPTVGEELFLVHLARAQEEKEEGPDSLPRSQTSILPATTIATTTKPSRKEDGVTPGEELWRVHLKRSQDRKDEIEKEEQEKELNKPPEKKKMKQHKTAPNMVMASSSQRTISLRSREVAMA